MKKVGLRRSIFVYASAFLLFYCLNTNDKDKKITTAMTCMILSFISVNSFEWNHEASLNGQSRFGIWLTKHSCQNSLKMHNQQALCKWPSCFEYIFLYQQNGQIYSGFLHYIWYCAPIVKWFIVIICPQQCSLMN